MRNLVITIELIEDENVPWQITVKIYDNCSFISGNGDENNIHDLKKEDSEIKFVRNTTEIEDTENTVLILEQKQIDNFKHLDKTKLFVIIDSSKENSIEDTILQKNNVRLIEDFKCDAILNELDYDGLQPLDIFFKSNNIKEKLISFLNTHYTPLHYKMNSSIKYSVIKDDGKLHKKDWGIAEMKIAAGYLAGKEISDIGGKGDKNLDILRAIPVKDNSGFYRLGYEFKLKRPKEVLITGISVINEDKKLLSELEKLSIKVQSSYNSSIKEADYEFMLIFDSDAFCDKIKAENTLIENYPYRIFLISDNSNTALNNFTKRIVYLPFNEIKTNIDYRENEDGKQKQLINFLNFLIELKKINSMLSNSERFKLFLYEKWIDHLKGWRNIDSDKTLSLYLKLTEDSNSAALPTDAQNVLNNIINNIEDKTKKLVALKMKKEIGQALKNVIGIGDKNYSPSTVPPILTVDKDINDKLESLCPRIKVLKKEEIAKGDKLGIYYLRHKAMTDVLYSENMTGAAIHLPIFANLPNEEYFKQKLIYQMVENGLICIAVADERFVEADFSFEDKQNFSNIKIKFVKTVLSYKMEFTDITQIDKAIELTKDLSLLNGIDVLIIHQGILDKIFNRQEERDAYVDKLREKIPFIVITSGRGKPDVPKGTKFLPFAIIEDCLLSKPPSKFILTHNIMNLKDIKEGKS